MHDLREDRVQVAGVELALLRPARPEALIDEEAFATDEFLPYWAELWPAARALAEELPDVAGCGSSSSAAASASRARRRREGGTGHGRRLGRRRGRAARGERRSATGSPLRAEVRDWREPWDERFDLALAADVLYERRNVEPVLARLLELAPVALVGLAGPAVRAGVPAARACVGAAGRGDRQARSAGRPPAGVESCSCSATS